MTSAWRVDTDVEPARHADDPDEFEYDVGDCEAQRDDCCAECVAAHRDCESADRPRRRAGRPGREPPGASAYASRDRQLNLSEYAAIAGAVVNQFIETFDAPSDPYARAALRYSPVLLTSPQSRGSGVEGLLLDPRFVGGALVAGIVVIGQNRNQGRTVADIEITAPVVIPVGATVTLRADVVVTRGRPMADAQVTWASGDTDLATIDPRSGVLKVNGRALLDPGVRPLVEITATAGAVSRWCLLRLVPGPP